MLAEPQKEHHWLEKLVGEWTFEHECAAGPDQSPMKSTGSESVHMLGGLWAIAEGQGEMPGGGPAKMVMTIGYDPQKQRYIGSWIGSMMTHMWIYEGSLNESKTTLTLNAEGPSMAGDGTMAKYQDIIEFLSDDHRTLSSQVQNADGSWNRFMTAHYRRTK